MADTDAEPGEVDDIIEEAKEAFNLCVEVEAENRKDAQDDIRFARLGEQWPEKVRRDRELDGRPCLTINRLPAIIRQVVNDARQNKPGITVHPVDEHADSETSEILNGLVRQIERSSDAEVAYDTALDFAVTGGFGYFRINTRYSTDDTFDQDICIERVSNPFSVYGDPYSTAADSSDWNTAFVVDLVPKDLFKRKYKGADAVDWDVSDYSRLKAPWIEGEQVLVAEYWTREETKRQIVLMSMPQGDADPATMARAAVIVSQAPPMGSPIIDMEVYKANKDLFDACGMKLIGKPRDVPSHKVKQTLMTGAEVLEEVEWKGRYIPIIPVYGEEIVVDGKRRLRSLVRDAKDSQRMFNYWRPLALDTPLPTPSGWTTMGAVQVGDELFDETGAPCKVVGKSPVHINRRCYRVEFDDGSHIIADGEHPWRVEERAGRNSAGIIWQTRDLTTADLVASQHFIPVTTPLDCEDADLPVHPYVLGLWLGDGHTMSSRITPGDEDVREVRERIEACGYHCGPNTDQPDRHATFSVHGLTPNLREAGVLGFKHIPRAYLRASVAQRRALLQGLMDSDGSISATTGACDFTTTSDALAAGFVELVRSLGIKAKFVTRQGRASKLVGGANKLLQVTQFYFTAYADDDVFGLARKKAMLGGRPEHRRRTKRHGIRSVMRVSSVPVQCVAIDAPSHLFLAGEGMVPTHNTTSTELVALAPKAPFIGKVGQFDTDAGKWATANSQSWAYIEYDDVTGAGAPQRQPFAGIPAGAIQEAINAADDIRVVTGLHEASLGQPSNETSGKAILARQREGDVSSFHFIDNLSRAIRHAGRIIIDLIPHVYSAPRIVRILGPDNETHQVPIHQTTTIQKKGEDGQMQEIERIFDLSVGKYDVTVSAGPSFASLREEAATQMMALIQAYPPAAPIIGDLLAKNLEWPGADDIADRLKAMLPANLQGDNAEAQAAQQQIVQLSKNLQAAMERVKALEGDKTYKAKELDIEVFRAETERMRALAPKGMPLSVEEVAPVVMESLQQIMANMVTPSGPGPMAAPMAPPEQAPGQPEEAEAMPDADNMPPAASDAAGGPELPPAASDAAGQD